MLSGFLVWSLGQAIPNNDELRIPSQCVDSLGNTFSDETTAAADFRGKWHLVKVSLLTNITMEFGPGSYSAYEASDEDDITTFVYGSDNGVTTDGYLKDIAPGMLHHSMEKYDDETEIFVELEEIFELSPVQDDVVNYCVVHHDAEFSFVTDRSRHFAWVSTKAEIPSDEVMANIYEIAAELEMPLVDPTEGILDMEVLEALDVDTDEETTDGEDTTEVVDAETTDGEDTIEAVDEDQSLTDGETDREDTTEADDEDESLTDGETTEGEETVKAVNEDESLTDGETTDDEN